MIKNLLNASDYEVIKYRLYIKNDTSQTNYMDFKNILLISLEEKSFTIVSPDNLFACNHNLTICFQLSTLKILDRFPKDSNKNCYLFTGKVIQKNQLDEKGKSESKIELTQFDSKEWEQVLMQLKNRSDLAISIFQKGKGMAS